MVHSFDFSIYQQYYEKCLDGQMQIMDNGKQSGFSFYSI